MVPTLDGWIGTATVVKDQMPDKYLVSFDKDDVPTGEDRAGYAHSTALKLIAGSLEKPE